MEQAGPEHLVDSLFGQPDAGGPAEFFLPVGLAFDLPVGKVLPGQRIGRFGRNRLVRDEKIDFYPLAGPEQYGGFFFMQGFPVHFGYAAYAVFRKAGVAPPAVEAVGGRRTRRLEPCVTRDGARVFRDRPDIQRYERFGGRVLPLYLLQLLRLFVGEYPAGGVPVGNQVVRAPHRPLVQRRSGERHERRAAVDDVVVGHFRVIDRQHSVLESSADIVHDAHAAPQRVAVFDMGRRRFGQYDGRRGVHRLDHFLVQIGVLEFLGDLEHPHVAAQSQPDRDVGAACPGRGRREGRFRLALDPLDLGQIFSRQDVVFRFVVASVVSSGQYDRAVGRDVDRVLGADVPQEEGERAAAGLDVNQRRFGAGLRSRAVDPAGDGGFGARREAERVLPTGRLSPDGADGAYPAVFGLQGDLGRSIFPQDGDRSFRSVASGQKGRKCAQSGEDQGEKFSVHSFWG